MSRNHNYLKMQAYGDWLERLLSPQVEDWEWLELLQQAVKLLNLHYETPCKHPFFEYIDELSRQKKRLDLVCELKKDFNSESINRIRSYGNPQILLYSIESAKNLFRIIYEDSLPWNISLNNLLDKEYVSIDEERVSSLIDDSSVDREQSVIDAFREFNKEVENNLITDVEGFYYNYNFVGEKLISTKDKIQKIKVLFVVRDSNLITMSTTPEGELLPFYILIPKIFFDFLFYGGQEYISFCQNKNCGRFIVAQRKGCRKFCSDKCRLEKFHSNK